MRPRTAVQQDIQRLGKAGGSRVLQSVGPAEMNREGSTQALPRPSHPVLREKDREKQVCWTHFSVDPVLWGLWQRLRTFQHIFSLKKNNVTLPKNWAGELIMHQFITPTTVFSFYIFPASLPPLHSYFTLWVGIQEANHLLSLLGLKLDSLVYVYDQTSR